MNNLETIDVLIHTHIEGNWNGCDKAKLKHKLWYPKNDIETNTFKAIQELTTLCEGLEIH